MRFALRKVMAGALLEAMREGIENYGRLRLLKQKTPRRLTASLRMGLLPSPNASATPWSSASFNSVC